MEDFLSSRRASGYAVVTIVSNRRYLHVFLEFLHGVGICSPDSIRSAHIAAFVESRKDTPLSVKYCMFAVTKGFLEYLDAGSPVSRNLSCTIPKVKKHVVYL